MAERYVVALGGQPLFAAMRSAEIVFVPFVDAGRFVEIRNAERVATAIELVYHLQVEVLSEDEGRQRAAVAENTDKLDRLMSERYGRTADKQERAKLLKQLEREGSSPVNVRRQDETPSASKET